MSPTTSDPERLRAPHHEPGRAPHEEPGRAPHHDPGRTAPQHRRPWSVLVLLCVAQFMVVLDITVVNVALPSIGTDLGFAASDLQWVVSAYVLFTGGLLLLGGRLADILG